MTRRRISNRTPRELTAKERSALSDVVLELDSDFRVKTGSVDDVSQVLPEVGAVVLNNLDGRLYYADQVGWHRQGDPYSPITLFVDFDGVTQLTFRWRAPSTSTITIHWGDGTESELSGQDGTIVDSLSTYAEAGKYYFYLSGDIIDITYFDVTGETVIGSINGAVSMVNLIDAHFSLAPGVYGDVSYLAQLPSLTNIQGRGSGVSGSVEAFAARTNITILQLYDTKVSGDASKLAGSAAYLVLYLDNTKVTYDSKTPFLSGSQIRFQDCNWTSKMVDNALISFSDGGVTGKIINLGGNNAKRTSASDAAFAIVNANNTLTVNE